MFSFLSWHREHCLGFYQHAAWATLMGGFPGRLHRMHTMHVVLQAAAQRDVSIDGHQANISMLSIEFSRGGRGSGGGALASSATSGTRAGSSAPCGTPRRRA